MQYFPLIEPSIDQFGFMTQIKTKDGGDSLQRESSLMLMAHLLYKHQLMTQDEYDFIKSRFLNNLKKIECKMWGNYKRHPDTSMWYSYPDRMSRDQLAPTIMALAAIGARKELWKCLLGHAMRGMLFTTNIRENWVYPPNSPKHTADQDYSAKLPDLTFMEVWSYYLRACKSMAICLYPLLCILDLELLVNSVISNYKAKNPTFSDDINHILAVMYSSLMPTPISWLAKKIYSKRPLTAKYNTAFGPQSAMEYYCRLGGDEGPALDKISKDLIFLLK